MVETLFTPDLRADEAETRNYTELKRSALSDSMAVLKQRLHSDGYLFLPGFHRPDAINAATNAVYHYISQMEKIPEHGVQMVGDRNITHQPALLRILESERLFNFFDSLFGEASLTYAWKWLRAFKKSKTPVHLDHVYMGTGDPNEIIYTVWTPFVNIPHERGGLYLVEDSHKADSYRHIRNSYGNSNVDHDPIHGGLIRDPKHLLQKYGGQLLSSTYQAGDILIFGMKMLHGSFENLTDQFRISCDVRFQPASQKLDPRYAGDNPKGHYNWVPEKSMDEHRKELGI